MQHPVLARAIERLVAAGEQAGISVEQMILILNAGVSVEALLDVIDQRLQAPTSRTPGAPRSRPGETGKARICWGES